MSIDFIEVETSNEGCTSETKKVIKLKKIEKFDFFNFSSFFSIILQKKRLFSKYFLFAVTRRAGCLILSSKSNTATGGKPSTWFPPGGTRRAGWK